MDSSNEDDDDDDTFQDSNGKMCDASFTTLEPGQGNVELILNQYLKDQIKELKEDEEIVSQANTVPTLDTNGEAQLSLLERHRKIPLNPMTRTIRSNKILSHSQKISIKASLTRRHYGEAIHSKSLVHLRGRNRSEITSAKLHREMPLTLKPLTTIRGLVLPKDSSARQQANRIV